MHHTENLTGWNGDPKHPGWRKIVDAVGRKLDRPGLGELAALQGVADGVAWKKWAEKYPHDSRADEAWARAEELEIGAARERMARDRDAAKRKAQEPERRSTPPMSPRPAPVELAAHEPRQFKPALIVFPVLIAAGLIVGGWYFLSQAPTPSPVSAPSQAELAQRQTPPASAATTDVATLTPAAPDPAASAKAALDRVPARYWSVQDAGVLVYSVLRNTTMASLRAAAASDARAKVVLGEALQFGLGAPVSGAQAVAFLREAANAGNARAQYDMGYAYRQGDGVEQNVAEAMRYYRLSADKGNARAQNEIGVRLAHGFDGAELHRDEGVHYLRLASDQNFADAQENLAYIYIDSDPAEHQRLTDAAATNKGADAELQHRALQYFGLQPHETTPN
jgi:TPR repeat protein